MKHRHDILFLIADAGQARLVRRSGPADDFRSVRDIDGSGALKAARVAMAGAPSGRGFASASGVHHPVQGRGDAHAQAQADFARLVAAEAADYVRENTMAGVVIVAPPHMLAAIRPALEDRAAVLGDLGKDLVNVPAHELGRWLNGLELAATAA